MSTHRVYPINQRSNPLLQPLDIPSHNRTVILQTLLDSNQSTLHVLQATSDLLLLSLQRSQRVVEIRRGLMQRGQRPKSGQYMRYMRKKGCEARQNWLELLGR